MRALLLVLVIPTSVAAQANRQPAAPAPLSAFQQHKARSLLRESLPCLGCHELDGEGGRTAPSLTTVTDRRSAEYIRAIIQDPQRVVSGAAMPEVLMTLSTRETIIRYLTRGARAGGLPPPPSSLTGDSLPVAALYNRWCSSCHGSTGRGDGPNARHLPVKPAVHTSAAQMSARSDDALFDAIAGGGAIMGKSPRMPPFGASLSPAEIRSLVAYIRTLCRCTGPAWSRTAGSR